MTVADFEPGDVVGVAYAPLLRVPLNALQHADEAADPPPWPNCKKPGLSGHKLACQRRSSLGCDVALAGAIGTIEPRPAFFVLKRLGPTAATPAGDFV